MKGKETDLDEIDDLLGEQRPAVVGGQFVHAFVMRDGTPGLDVELGRRWQVGRRLRLQGPCPMGL